MKADTRADRILLAFGLCLGLVPGSVAIAVLPNFKEFFASFGGDLPMATGLVLRFYPALLAAPLLVAALWWMWPEKSQRGMAALLAGIACLVLIPLALAVAMYLPIARLAAPG